MSDTYDRFEDAASVFPEFRAMTPLERAWLAATGFARAPGNAMAGRYAPQTAVPGVLTEEDQYRMNHARDREVLDALNLGWLGPRGGNVASRAVADYAPSRLASGADRERPYSPFTNASGVFPDFEAAKLKPKRSIFGLLTGRGGERYQLWPEKLVRSAATLPGDVARGDVASGYGLRREDVTDVPVVGTGEREGGIPGLRSLFSSLRDEQRDNPAEILMERAQDLAGVLGGGPLTSRPSAATLASGAKLPRDIGGAGMTRRGLLDMFRAREKPVEQQVVEAPAPQLPAVQDPLSRLIGGGEAPKSALLDQLTTPPAAQSPNPAEGLMSQAQKLQAVLNPELDRRAVLRGIGATAANVSRVGQVAEALMKPAETVAAAPKIDLPKFEEVWKREGEGKVPDWALDEASDRAGEATADAFNKRPGMRKLYNKDNDAWQEKFDEFINSPEGDKINNKHTERALEDIEYEPEGGPRYHYYQLPGGENYRELLIKHPQQSKIDYASLKPEDLSAHETRPGFWDIKSKDGQVVAQYWGSGHTQQQMLQVAQQKLKDGELASNAPEGTHGSTYYSDTWDEPNVIGHLRMHDRDIPGVGKALHLEELHSEWHQQGSKRGYGPTDTSKWSANTVKSKYKGDSDFWMVKDDKGREIGTVRWAQDAQGAIKDVASRRLSIPDAPLKKDWPDYLLRRAIREAVEQGHDAVSWTPGEHQVDRYNTVYTPPGDGMKSATPEQQAYFAANPEVAAHIKGVHDFYDKHLVERANEIGKEYGAKVEQRPLHDNIYDPKEYDEYARMSYKERAKAGVQDKYEKMTDLQTNGLGSKQLGDVKAPVLKITPQLRKAVKDGTFSLLSDSGKPGAALAALEKIYSPHGQQGLAPIKTEKGWYAEQGGSAPGKFGPFKTEDEVTGFINRNGGHRPAHAFYSAAERAVASAKMEKGSPEQWVGYLRNQPGVRKEELDHLGLEGKLQGKQLTKEQVAAAIKEGSPTIKEVWKGGEPLDEGAIGDHAQEIMDRDHPDLTPEHAEYYGHYDDAVQEAESALRKEGTMPKFSEYQLPGGENYRELLMTMPSKVEKRPPGFATTEAAQNYNTRARQDYTSSHWDEPNVLGHLRMNDRMVDGPKLEDMWALSNKIGKALNFDPKYLGSSAPNAALKKGLITSQEAADWSRHMGFKSGHEDKPGVGLKSLHLEELQSDWHQKGRKEGYKGEVRASLDKVIDAERKMNIAQQRAVAKQANEGVASHLRVQAAARDPDYMAAARKYMEENERHNKEHPAGTGVPDAPFKQTWPDMLLRRAVREAAEKGYDSISWTPGDAQAARYDLSKQVERLTAYRTPEGKYTITVVPRGQMSPLGRNVATGVEGKELPGFIGKELADKIVQQNVDEKVYLEPDLKVGGEGMRAFYDKMLVDKANALGKKHGAKVEWKEISDAAPGADRYDPSKRTSLKVPVFRITKQLREHALREGFPLFSAALPFGSPDKEGK